MPTAIRAEDLLYDRTRLSIVALLAGNQGSRMAFTDVQQKLELTAGNLSSHLKLLEQHGFVIVNKQFKGKRPQTTLQISEIGRTALQQFVEELEQIIKNQ